MKPLLLPFLSVLAAVPVSGQHGAALGEWRFYGGDAGSNAARLFNLTSGDWPARWTAR